MVVEAGSFLILSLMCNEYGGKIKPLLVQINQLESFYFFLQNLGQRAGKTRTGGDHPLSALQLSAYSAYPGFGRPTLGPSSAQPPSDPGDGLPCPGHTLALRRAILFCVSHEAFLGTRCAVSWEGVSDTSLQFSLPALVNKLSI